MLSVLTFRTPDEAVEKANNTPYGLSAGVWTEKGSRILWMAERLRAGVVWANTYNRFDPTSPFGGYKESRLRPRGRPARAGAVPRLRRRGDLRRMTDLGWRFYAFMVAISVVAIAVLFGVGFTLACFAEKVA